MAPRKRLLAEVEVAEIKILCWMKMIRMSLPEGRLGEEADLNGLVQSGGGQ